MLADEFQFSTPVPIHEDQCIKALGNNEAEKRAFMRHQLQQVAIKWVQWGICTDITLAYQAIRDVAKAKSGSSGKPLKRYRIDEEQNYEESVKGRYYWGPTGVRELQIGETPAKCCKVVPLHIPCGTCEMCKVKNRPRDDMKILEE